MASTDTPVILYRYDASPFAHKIDHLLLLKGIPHHKVKISSVLPRPDISKLLGIDYRRVPVLAIGNDVYCDTSIISAALERRFPSSSGYGTIFPPRKDGGKIDAMLMQAFAQNYVEKTIFPIAPGLLPWEKFPESFLKDRGQLRGGTIDPKAMAANRPKALSSLLVHIHAIEQQLQDGREWLFDTTLPSLADISMYFVLAWVHQLSAKTLVDKSKHASLSAWLMRVAKYLESRKESAKSTMLSGAEAANLISTSSKDQLPGFDEVDAGRLGIQRGGMVWVTPDDNGMKNPTQGKLVALTAEEVVVETKGSSAVVRCHFPRIGFSIKGVDQSKL